MLKGVNRLSRTDQEMTKVVCAVSLALLDVSVSPMKTALKLSNGTESRESCGMCRKCKKVMKVAVSACFLLWAGLYFPDFYDFFLCFFWEITVMHGAQTGHKQA